MTLTVKEREAVLPFAQTSHRAMELGINDDEEGE
jgi:hypothetical protein